jgi:hypothetical protein
MVGAPAADFTGGVGAIAYRVRHALGRGGGRPAIGLIVIVALATGLVLTLVAGASRTLTTADRYERAGGQVAGSSIQQDHGAPRNQEVAALPAVKSVETVTFIFAGLIRPGEDQPVETIAFVGSYGAVGRRITQGRAPDPDVPGEFVASTGFMKTIGAHLGDTFNGVSFTQEQGDTQGFDAPDPQGPTWKATLVGVVDGPSEMEAPSPIVVFPSSLLTLGDIGTSASVGTVVLQPGASVEDLRSQLDGLPDGSVFTLSPLVLIPTTVRAAINAQGQGLAVLAMIVAVAAVVVVGQLLSRQVKLPEGERLAANALGMTRVQIVADSVGQAVVPTVVGALLGAGLAYALSGIFPLKYVRPAEAHPGLLFDPLVHLGGAAVFAVVVVTWVLVTRASGDRRVEGVRRLTLVDRLAPAVRPISAGTGLRFAFSRPSKDGGSIRGSVIGLVLVLAVLVGALTFGTNLGRLIKDPARSGTNYDSGLGQGGDVVPAETQAALVADDDVSGFTLYGTTDWSVGVEKFSVTGMDQVKGHLGPILFSGTEPSTADEIILGRVAAKHLDKRVGDILEIQGPTGSVPFRVTGIAVIPSIDGGEGMGEGGVVTLDGLRRLDPEASLGTAAVKFRDGAPKGTNARLMAETGVDMGRPDPPSTIQNLARVRRIPFVVAGALALLALLSIGHQLILSASRRRRDVAVLRALGAERGWVSGVMHWQASVFALVVAVLAVPIGIAGGRTVFRVFVEHLGALDEIGEPFVYIAAMALGLVVLANVVAMVPARRTRREPPAVTLLGE